MEQEEPKRRHGGKRKKSLALKILDREKLLEQAQQTIMGMSASELRRFIAARNRKLEHVQDDSKPQEPQSVQVSDTQTETKTDQENTEGLDKLVGSPEDSETVRDETQEPGSTAIGYAFRNRILNSTWSK